MNFEKIFISSLGSGENLKLEIDQNINLIDTADKKLLLGIDVLLGFISKSRKEEELGGIDADKILYLLEKERPDVYGIIRDNPNGKIWVASQIINFKKRFL